MPLSPQQCTGELAVQNLCSYIDLVLDSLFFQLYPKSGPEAVATVIISGSTPDIKTHLHDDIINLVVEIYRGNGWDVESRPSTPGTWKIQFTPKPLPTPINPESPAGPSIN